MDHESLAVQAIKCFSLIYISTAALSLGRSSTLSSLPPRWISAAAPYFALDYLQQLFVFPMSVNGFVSAPLPLAAFAALAAPRCTLYLCLP